MAKDKWKNKEDKSTMNHREMRVSKSASEEKNKQTKVRTKEVIGRQ